MYKIFFSMVMVGIGLTFTSPSWAASGGVGGQESPQAWVQNLPTRHPELFQYLTSPERDLVLRSLPAMLSKVGTFEPAAPRDILDFLERVLPLFKPSPLESDRDQLDRGIVLQLLFKEYPVDGTKNHIGLVKEVLERGRMKDAHLPNEQKRMALLGVLQGVASLPQDPQRRRSILEETLKFLEVPPLDQESEKRMLIPLGPIMKILSNPRLPLDQKRQVAEAGRRLLAEGGLGKDRYWVSKTLQVVVLIPTERRDAVVTRFVDLIHLADSIVPQSDSYNFMPNIMAKLSGGLTLDGRGEWQLLHDGEGVPWRSDLEMMDVIQAVLDVFVEMGDDRIPREGRWHLISELIGSRRVRLEAGGPARGRGVAFEVHGAADAEVVDESSAGAGAAGGAGCVRPQKLNEAVLAKVRTRLDAEKVPLVKYDEVMGVLHSWVDKTYARQSAAERAQTKSALLAGLDEAEAQRQLQEVYTFLKRFHPERVEGWMEQFVGESIEAYKGRANPLSCVKGIRERIVLGLRDIDPQLDALFGQMEGPALMRSILAQSNFGDSAEKAAFVAKKLLARGYKPGKTSPKEGAQMFGDFLREQLRSYKVGDKLQKEFMAEIEAYQELIEGDLEEEAGILGKAVQALRKKHAAETIQKAFRKYKRAKARK